MKKQMSFKMSQRAIQFSVMTALLVGTALPSFSQEGGAEPAMDEALRSHVASFGGNLAWTGQSQQIGMSVVVPRALISRGDFNLTADQLAYDGENLMFQGMTITPKGGGRGNIKAERMALSGKASLPFLFHELDHISEFFATPKLSRTIGDGADIEGREEDHHGGEGFCDQDGDTARHVEIDARGVTMQGDMDAMLPELPYSETITIAHFNMKDRLDGMDDACNTHHQVELAGVAVRAVDGAAAHIGEISYEEQVRETLESDGDLTRIFADMKDIQIMDAGGFVSAMLDDLSLALVEDAAWYEAMSAMRDGGDTEAAALQALTGSVAGFGLTFSGLDVDTEGFFPADMIRAFGLEEIDRITGSAQIDASLLDGDGRITMEGSFPQIVRGEFSLATRLPKDAGAELPAMITDRLPVPSELLGFELMGFHLLYEDQNIGKMFETAKGYHPSERVADMAELIKARLGSAPSSVADLVDASFGTLVEIAKNGGRVTAKPSEPQSLMSLGMQVLVNPTGLSELLGIDTEIWAN